VFKGFIATAVVVLLGLQAVARGQQQPGEETDVARARGQVVQISLMETALVAAIRSGAGDLVNQLTKTTQAPAQGALLGTPQATGFRLPDYGYFFHLRVPGMRGWVTLAAPLLAERWRAQQPPPPTRLEPGQAQATNVSDAGSPVQAPPPVAPVDVVTVLNDPEAAYVRAIRTAVIEAMLENSGGLRVPPDQMLTVAARKDTNPNPLNPTDEVRTMTFTVKGSDLEAFRQGRFNLAEAKALVIVRED
jgi:hypothetical protein